MGKKSSLLISAALAGMTSSSNGAITYIESVSGDLANTTGDAPLLTLGTNQVNGSVSTSDIRDHFILQGFTALNRASINFASPIEGGTLQYTVNDSTFASVLGSSTSPTTSIGFVVPGNGQVGVIVHGVEIGASFSYSATTTDVVPEPSTSALGALAALAALARRKRD